MNNGSDDIPKKEPPGRYRELRGFYQVYARSVTAFSAVLSFIFVFKISIFGYVMPEMSYFSVLIASFLSCTFLLFPATKKAPRDRVPWYDTLFCIASLLGPIYIMIYNMDIILGGWEISPPTIGKILALIEDSGVNLDIVLEACFVRGLEYYTGMIFESYIPGLEIALGGGGRYDKLIQLFGGESLSAVGVAHGIDRIALALKKQKVIKKSIKEKFLIKVTNR